MNTWATRGSVSALALFLIFAGIAFSVVTAPTLEAKKISTSVPMEKRKAIHEESCKSLGGKFDFVEYHNGAEPVLRTECSHSDGSTTTCTNTPTTMDCRSSTDREIATWTPADPVGFPDTTAPHTAEQPQATPVTTDLADPDLPQEVNPGLTEPTAATVPSGPTLRSTMELPQEVNPGLREPTPTAVPQGPTVRPTVEPATDPLPEVNPGPAAPTPTADPQVPTLRPTLEPAADPLT